MGKEIFRQSIVKNGVVQLCFFAIKDKLHNNLCTNLRSKPLLRRKTWRTTILANNNWDSVANDSLRTVPKTNEEISLASSPLTLHQWCFIPPCQMMLAMSHAKRKIGQKLATLNGGGVRCVKSVVPIFLARIMTDFYLLSCLNTFPTAKMFQWASFRNTKFMSVAVSVQA